MSFTTSNIDDILRYHKGRVVKVKTESNMTVSKTSGERLFPTAIHKTSSGIKTSNLSPKSKAFGITNGISESVIKIDKASKGIKSERHMMAAADYISRHGKIDLEDEEGNLLTHDEMQERISAWCKSQNVPNVENDKKRPADARRLIISCPKGTNPEAARAAAKELARECLADEDYSYLFAIHNRSPEMPNEPDHPHIHFLIKSVNSKGKRLNLRKGDLRYLRERFAVIAKKHGIEMNATSRAQRGQTKKSKTQERYHEEAKQWINHTEVKHPYQKNREREIDEALQSGQSLKKTEAQIKAEKTRQNMVANAKKYIKELKTSKLPEDVKLASELDRYISGLPPVETSQEEILRKIKEFNQKQKAKGYDIKEQIRKRKSQKKTTQSQAQKWAIHRKKNRSNER